MAWRYARIFVRGHYLFREANSFPRAKLKENCELRGTDNVQGQISEHIFAPNGDYCLYYPLNLFATRAVLKIGEYSRIFSSFSWGIFGHVTRLDHSRASEKIWWIIISNIPLLQLGNIRSRDVFRPIVRKLKYLMDFKLWYSPVFGHVMYLAGLIARERKYLMDCNERYVAYKVCISLEKPACFMQCCWIKVLWLQDPFSFTEPEKSRLICLGASFGCEKLKGRGHEHPLIFRPFLKVLKNTLAEFWHVGFVLAEENCCQVFLLGCSSFSRNNVCKKMHFS